MDIGFDLPKPVTLNPGHAESVQKDNPLLIDQKGVILKQIQEGERSPVKTVMLLPVEAIASYLQEHQVDKPHAVIEIFTIIAEELKQYTDPNRHIEYFRSDLAQLQEVETDTSDQDAINEIQQNLAGSRNTLSYILTTVPHQLLAINSLVLNEDINQLISGYIEKYGNIPRLDTAGRLTPETYGEHLIKIFETIRSLMKLRKTQIQKTCEQTDFLKEHSFPIPNKEELEPVKA